MLHTKTMKFKRFWLPLAVCAALLCALTATAFAAAVSSAQLRPDVTIIIDGVEQTFYNVNGQEVHPILRGGTTYLPVRAIGEVMGKNVDWNQASKTVTLSGTRTTFTTGTPDANAAVQNISVSIREDFTIIVDGRIQTFRDVDGRQVFPILYNGSTYLPLRAIGGLMGKAVGWDGAAKTVTLTSPSASNGDLVTDADSFSSAVPQPSPPGVNAGLITVEAAEAAALNHAGLSANQVTFIKHKLEWDDGRQIYDIEFYTGDYKEYEYEIDAVTGAVLEFDCDIHPSAPLAPSNEANGPLITRDRAREIALGKVPGAAAQNVAKLKLDHDDGMLIYEVKIVYGSMKYEFEISASDGAILEMDMESIHH